MNLEVLAKGISDGVPSQNCFSTQARSSLLTEVLAALFLAGSATAQAQVPAELLAKPPRTAQEFTILSPSGTNGKGYIWTANDGSRMSRDSVLLRGMVWELEERIEIGSDGMPSKITVRGSNPQGDAAETFQVIGGEATWKSPVDAGSRAYVSPSFYATMSGTFTGDTQVFTETLLASPGKSMLLLPGGRAQAERLTDAVVGKGQAKKTVIAWAVSGIAPSPIPLWMTAGGKFFGQVSGLSVLPVGYEGDLTTLLKAQDDALAARSPALVKELVKIPQGPVAFTHVRAFLDGTHFAEDQTVVVDHGLIVAAGPARTTPLPNNSQVLDGSGKTLVPGLWDAHQHVGDDFSGPFLLSLGITSARDPGNLNELTIGRAVRRAKGELLSPKVYPSALRR